MPYNPYDPREEEKRQKTPLGLPVMKKEEPTEMPKEPLSPEAQSILSELRKGGPGAQAPPERDVGTEAAMSLARGVLVDVPSTVLRVAGFPLQVAAPKSRPAQAIESAIQYIEESPEWGGAMKPSEIAHADVWENPETLLNPNWWAAHLPQQIAPMLITLGGGLIMRAGALARYGSMLKAATAAKDLKKAAQIEGLISKAQTLGTMGAAMSLELGEAADRMAQWERDNPDKPIHWGTKIVAGLGTGVIAGSLEAYSINRIFGRKSGEALVNKVVDSILTEGSTEGAQTLIENAFSKWGFDPSQKFTEGLLESIIIGAALGGITGGVETTFEKSRKRPILGMPTAEEVAEKYPPFPEAPPEAGPAVAPPPPEPPPTAPAPPEAPAPPALPLPEPDFSPLIFSGNPLADVLAKFPDVNEAIPRLAQELDGNLEKAERFYGLWRRGDYVTALNEFPELAPKDHQIFGPSNLGGTILGDVLAQDLDADETITGLATYLDSMEEAQRFYQLYLQKDADTALEEFEGFTKAAQKMPEADEATSAAGQVMAPGQDITRIARTDRSKLEPGQTMILDDTGIPARDQFREYAPEEQRYLYSMRKQDFERTQQDKLVIREGNKKFFNQRLFRDENGDLQLRRKTERPLPPTPLMPLGAAVKSIVQPGGPGTDVNLFDAQGRPLPRRLTPDEMDYNARLIEAWVKRLNYPSLITADEKLILDEAQRKGLITKEGLLRLEMIGNPAGIRALLTPEGMPPVEPEPTVPPTEPEPGVPPTEPPTGANLEGVKDFWLAHVGDEKAAIASAIDDILGDPTNLRDEWGPDEVRFGASGVEITAALRQEAIDYIKKNPKDFPEYIKELKEAEKAPAAAKEPWEMTIREYAERREFEGKRLEELTPEEVQRFAEAQRQIVIRTGKPEEMPDINDIDALRQFLKEKIDEVESIQKIGQFRAPVLGGGLSRRPTTFTHFRAVKKALKEGKAVPPEVLAEYKDLVKEKPKPKKKAPAGVPQAKKKAMTPEEAGKEYVRREMAKGKWGSSEIGLIEKRGKDIEKMARRLKVGKWVPFLDDLVPKDRMGRRHHKERNYEINFLVDIGFAERAWEEGVGNTFYARTGTPLREGLTQRVEEEPTKKGTKPAPTTVARKAIPEKLEATKKGNAVGFDEKGNTITVSYLSGRKAWVVTTVKTETNAAIKSENFGDKGEALAHAAALLDYAQTKEKAWWDVEGQFTEATEPEATPVAKEGIAKWKGNVLEWAAPTSMAIPKTAEARMKRFKTFKGSIKVGEIGDAIPLTDRVIDHWQKNKSELGYVNMMGLNEQDVISIISATRRGDASVSVERMGKLAFYKLKEGAIKKKTKRAGVPPGVDEFRKKFGSTKGDRSGVMGHVTDDSLKTPEGHIIKLVTEGGKLPEGVAWPEGVSRAWLVETGAIDAEPDVFQFKMGFEEGTGAGLALTGTEKWEPSFAGVVIAYRYPDGRVSIVDGHQRLALAKKQKVSHLLTEIWDASAMSTQDARAKAARRNIAMGTGTEMDYAKYFRDTGATEDFLKREGVDLKSKKVRTALALSKTHEDVFMDAVNGKLPMSFAAVIGQSMAEDPDGQVAVSREIQELDRQGKRLDDNIVLSYVRKAQMHGVTTQKQVNLFGEEEFTKALFYEAAYIEDYIRRTLTAEKNTLGRAVVGKKVLEAVGSRIADLETREAAKEMRADIYIYTIAKDEPGSKVAGVIAKYAPKFAEATNKSQRDEVLGNAYKEARDAITADHERLMGRGGEGGLPGGGEGIAASEAGEVYRVRPKRAIPGKSTLKLYGVKSVFDTETGGVGGMGHAAVVNEGWRGGTITMIHITDNPDGVIQTIEGKKDLDETYEGYGEIGPGLYGSYVPQLWVGRSKGKWSFLNNLTPSQKKAFHDAVLAHPNAQTPYISANERSYLERDMGYWLNGELGNGIVGIYSDQPYNIRSWEPKFLKPLGIDPGAQPQMLPVNLRGRFAEVTGQLTNDEAADLKRMGFDGAFQRGTDWGTIGQLVVWNKDAVVSVGNVAIYQTDEEITRYKRGQKELPIARDFDLEGGFQLRSPKPPKKGARRGKKEIGKLTGEDVKEIGKTVVPAEMKEAVAKVKSLYPDISVEQAMLVAKDETLYRHITGGTEIFWKRELEFREKAAEEKAKERTLPGTGYGLFAEEEGRKYTADSIEWIKARHARLMEKMKRGINMYMGTGDFRYAEEAAQADKEAQELLREASQSLAEWSKKEWDKKFAIMEKEAAETRELEKTFNALRANDTALIIELAKKHGSNEAYAFMGDSIGEQIDFLRALGTELSWTQPIAKWRLRKVLGTHLTYIRNYIDSQRKAKGLEPIYTEEKGVYYGLKETAAKPLPGFPKKQRSLFSQKEISDEAKIAHGSADEALRKLRAFGATIPATDPGRGIPGYTLSDSVRRYYELKTREFGRTGRVDIVGTKLNGDHVAEELAVMAQALRSPEMEILQVFFTKGNEVVGHHAWTSGNISSVNVGYLNGFMDWATRTAKSYGADKIHFAHNHPSGNTTMSTGDRSLQEALHKGGEGLVGPVKGLGDMMGEFIVIDHDTFTYLDTIGGQLMVMERPYKPQNLMSEWKRRGQLKSAEDYVALAQNLPLDPETHVGLVFVDAGLNVNGMILQDRSLFMGNPADAFDAVMEMMKAHDAKTVAILGHSGDPALTQFIQHGINLMGEKKKSLSSWLLDVISWNPNLNAYESLRRSAPESLFIEGDFTAVPKGWQLFEAGESYMTDEAVVDAFIGQTIAPKKVKAPALERLKGWREAWGPLKNRLTHYYTEIVSGSYPIERRATQAQRNLIPGVTRDVGSILHGALSFHRGHMGQAGQALTGTGVWVPERKAGFESKVTLTLKDDLALMLADEGYEWDGDLETVSDIANQLDKRAKRKVLRLLRKIENRLAQEFTTGDIEHINEPLSDAVEPLRELAAKLDMDEDAVFEHCFSAYMPSERNLELAGVIGDRKTLIEVGVDVDASEATISALKRMYGEDFATFEEVAGRVRKWADAAIIEPLVRVGRLSEATANIIRKSNRYYVPFFRLMTEMEEKGQVASNVNLFEVKNIYVKEIKGSERQIIDPLEMLVRLAFNAADTMGRGYVAQTLAELPEFSDAGAGIEVVPAKKFPVPVEIKQEIDPIFRGQLDEVAKTVAQEIKYRHTIRKNTLGRFRHFINMAVQSGEITEPQAGTLIELMFGTYERTYAHEIGHGIDHKYNLFSILGANKDMKEQLRTIADLRVPEFAPQSYRRYARKKTEQIAEFVNHYLTQNQIARELAPDVVAAFENFLNQHDELKILLTARPTSKAEIKTFSHEVWVKSPFAPVKNAMLIYRAGVPYWVKMPEDLYKAAIGTNMGETGILLKLSSRPAAFLRAGAVFSPEFIMRNPIRDVIMAWCFSRYGFGFRGWFQDFYRLVAPDEEAKLLWARFQAGGGTFADLATTMVKMRQLTVDEITGKGKNIKYFSHPLEALRDLSAYMENVTRFSVYRQSYENLIKQGVDKATAHARAIHEARTVTLDFHRFGGNRYVRVLNMIIPFFNAGIQGVDKMATELTGPERGRVLQKILMGITLPSLLLWALTQDDDRIRELEDWERNLFWHFPLGGKNDPIARIPKPFEIGIAFGSLPERMLDFWKTQDPTGFKHGMRQMAEAMLPNMVPTVLRPGLEQLSNYNFFLDRPIEDASLQNLPVELRSKPWTNEVSRAFSQYFGKFVGVSPVMFENHIRSIGGGLAGNYFLPLTDFALRKTGAIRDISQPDRELIQQVPGIRAIFSKEPTGLRAKSANYFFEKYHDAVVSDQGWKVLWNAGQMEDADKFLKDHPEAMFAKAMRKMMNEITQLKKVRDKIITSPKATSAQKREKLDQLDNYLDSITRFAHVFMSERVLNRVEMPPRSVAQDGTMQLLEKKKDKLGRPVELDTYYKYANEPVLDAYDVLEKDRKRILAMPYDQQADHVISTIQNMQATYKPVVKQPSLKDLRRAFRQTDLYDEPTRKERQAFLGLPMRARAGAMMTGYRPKLRRDWGDFIDEIQATY